MPAQVTRMTRQRYQASTPEKCQQREREGAIGYEKGASTLRDMKNGSTPNGNGPSTEFCTFLWISIETVVKKYSFTYSSEVDYVSRARQRRIVSPL